MDLLKTIDCKAILNAALKTGADFAEIYAEHTQSLGTTLRFRQVEPTAQSIEAGVGIRIIKNDIQVYGRIASFDKKELIKLATKLSLNFQGQQSIFVRDMKDIKTKTLDSSVKPHSSLTLKEKIDLLKTAENAIYSYSNEIVNAMCALREADTHVEIYNSYGRIVKFDKIHTRVVISATASYNGTFESNSFSPGYTKGLEILDDINFEERGREVAKNAVDLVHAPDCPSGEMTVILGNKFGGVLFHEACGHPLEANSIARKLSVYSNKLGDKIASDIVTAIDDGTIEGAYGYIPFDDEGNEPTKNVLIKDGVLNNFMIDNLSSSMLVKQNPGVDKEKFNQTGSCRRESYKYAPTTRMTNTYIANGTSTVDEIIKATKKGLYCVSFTGGQVTNSTNKFNFSVSLAYLIENGEIKNLVKGAGLIGYGYEILPKIDMIANDLELAAGTCGASSGQIPVTVGQPTLRISSITVAGSGNQD